MRGGDGSGGRGNANNASSGSTISARATADIATLSPIANAAAASCFSIVTASSCDKPPDLHHSDAPVRADTGAEAPPLKLPGFPVMLDRAAEATAEEEGDADGDSSLLVFFAACISSCTRPATAVISSELLPPPPWAPTGGTVTLERGDDALSGGARGEACAAMVTG